MARRPRTTLLITVHLIDLHLQTTGGGGVRRDSAVMDLEKNCFAYHLVARLLRSAAVIQSTSARLLASVLHPKRFPRVSLLGLPRQLI